MMRRNRNRPVSSAISSTGCSPLSRSTQRTSNSVPPIRSHNLSPIFDSERRRHSAASYTDWRYAPANHNLNERQNLIRPTWQYVQPGQLPARTLDRVNGIAVDESFQNSPDGRRPSVIFRHNSGVSSICGNGTTRPRILPVPSGAAFHRRSPNSQVGPGTESVVRDGERAGSSRMRNSPSLENGDGRVYGCNCARSHSTAGLPPHGGAGPPLRMAWPPQSSRRMSCQPDMFGESNAFGHAMPNSIRSPMYDTVAEALHGANDGINLNPRPYGIQHAGSDALTENGVRCSDCRSFIRRGRGDGQEAEPNIRALPQTPPEAYHARLGPGGVIRVAADALMQSRAPLCRRTGRALSRIVSYSKNSSDDEDVFDMCEKVILLGDSGVGKTCMMVRYRSGRFWPNHTTTLGIDFRNKVVVVDQTRVKLQIWDTAGQERFRSVTHAYYRDAHALLLLYDVTNKNTFDNIRAWLGEIREYANDTVVIVLIGNKADCSSSDRQVKREDGERLAREHQVPFLETSAKTGQNVELAFAAVARQLKSRTTGNGADGGFNVHEFVRDQTRARTICSQCKSM